MARFAILALFVTILALTGLPVKAQEKLQLEKTDIPADRLEKIRLLKEKVATKVAQLREQEKKPEVLGGKIRSASDSSLIVDGALGAVLVTIAEQAQIFQVNQNIESLKQQDIKEEQLILALGKKKNNTFVAERLYLRPASQLLIGKISTIDKPAGQFLLATMAGTTPIDVEKTTKTYQYTLEKGVIRSGFSKLKVNDLVHVIAKPGKDPQLVTAIRVLTILELTLTPTPGPENKEEVPNK